MTKQTPPPPHLLPFYIFLNYWVGWGCCFSFLVSSAIHDDAFRKQVVNEMHTIPLSQGLKTYMTFLCSTPEGKPNHHATTDVGRSREI